MNRLRELRNEKELSQSDVASIIGVTTAAYSNYEKGTRDISTDTLLKLSAFFGVSVDYILGKTYVRKENVPSTKIIIYGSIPAGIPMEMIEDIIDVEEISTNLLKGGKQFFGLKVKGNSMEDKYKDGDIVIFEKTENCESGQDCVVMVNGYDGTFKRVYKNEYGITLQPLNIDLYSPLSFTNEQIENLPVRIIGVAREIRRKL